MVEKSKEAAGSANGAMLEFIANISKELRTEMSGVIGTIDLLLKTDMSEQQINYAEMALTSANNLLNILSDLLDFSQIEEGKLLMETIDFNVQLVLDEVVSMLSPAARLKGMTLEAYVDENTVSLVKGDPARLRQVLVDLVSRSIKVTGIEGIAIHLKQLEEQEDWVKLEFRVADTNIGTAEEKHAEISDSFPRTGAPAAPQRGATGLGLTIAGRLATLMNGEICGYGNEGKGAAFALRAIFPKGSWETLVQRDKDVFDSLGTIREETKDSYSKGDGAAVLKPEKKWTGVRVLVVEDNPVNQQVAAAMVSHFGSRVDVAGTGKEAVEAVSRKSYDIVLMDCEMPVMDGYEATRIIRESESGSNLPRIPIIALTAHARAEDRDGCLKAGMDDYLAKPFHYDQLRSILERWLGAR
jgi:two-component system, sensor histidine kinase